MTAIVHTPLPRLLIAALSLAAPAMVAASDANQAVLERWRGLTGQALAVDDDGRLHRPSPWRLRGQVSVDVYAQDLDLDPGVPVVPGQLSPVDEGLHGRLQLQLDARTEVPDDQPQDYVLASLRSTDDRGQAPRYATQLQNLQAGRAAAGYGVAVGDVVANFSPLSSNLGLRGLQGALGWEQLALTAYAGIVAESWESLVNASPREAGQPARTQRLRDVAGSKLEWTPVAAWSLFATVQAYGDRASDDPLLTTPRAQGQVASLGARRAQENSTLALEAAWSLRDPDDGDEADGHAVTASFNQRWSRLGLRLLAQDIAPEFASLAQMAAPGMQEQALGVDVDLLPGVSWSVDARNGASRRLAAGLTEETELDTLSQRLNCQLPALPAWTLTLADLRNREISPLGEKKRNRSTQAQIVYAAQQWQAQLQHAEGAQDGGGNESDIDQTQLSLSRRQMLGGWSLGLQGLLGLQVQEQRTGGRTRQQHQRVDIDIAHKLAGRLTLMAAHTQTEPDAGSPTPDFDSWQYALDWTRPVAAAQWKAYVRRDDRNQGNPSIASDTTEAGLQWSRTW